MVLLATFVVIEARSEHALMPLRIFRNRDRSAANLIMLCLGTAMFGMFFFLTIFVQTVWGYSALKTGIGYLPMIAVIMVMAGVSAQLVTRIGARPLLLVGAAISFRRHVLAVPHQRAQHLHRRAARPDDWSPRPDWACCSCRVTLVALSRVSDRDAGLAASLPNVGQQVGGSIGLALLGTVAWTVVANTARHSAEAAKAAAATAAKAGHPVHVSAAQAKSATVAIYDHALSVGFSRGFEVSAGIMLLALSVTIVAIRPTREDLAGAAAATPGQPASAEPAAEPANS